ncbi:hypothetical protein [Massilia genomosp. 1]|uniref:Uncharacterized protein n=1 Tax=Massilia genomosp. 1 TaxID=2609280 RepID=A0ABX0MP25_9BURK|nr:hypothetical protein [Massilia genomosp. 1]NHZ64530.1 hypothetical protein [Massilia genomosp. 1]
MADKNAVQLPAAGMHAKEFNISFSQVILNTKHHYFVWFFDRFSMKAVKALLLRAILVLFSGNGSLKLHNRHSCFHPAIAICTLQKTSFLRS